MRRHRLFLILCAVLVSTAFFAPRAQAASPAIDVVRDANHDGIPDELYQQVRDLPLARDNAWGIAYVVDRLPYTPQTRALQARAAQLYYELLTATAKSGVPALSADQGQKIAAQLTDLNDQMMADPGYARTMQALTAMLAPAESGLYPSGAAPTANGSGGLAWDNLRRGDVLLVRSSAQPWAERIYAMWYDHSGIYDGNGWVYEANAGGVGRRPLSDWQRPGQYVALARPLGLSQEAVGRALDQVEAQYGVDDRSPYNYVYPNKWSDNSLYCSQLVWKVFDGAGADLDTNEWGYELWVAAKWGNWAVGAVARPAVAPDEIAASGHLQIYSQGWLPG